jgi:hypothetical protein
MRRQQLHEYVTDLVRQTWNGVDADVAEAVVDDDAFGALAYRLNEAGGGEAAGITEAWNELIDSLSDNDLDWLADRSENPAAWLCNRLSPA